MIGYPKQMREDTGAQRAAWRALFRTSIGVTRMLAMRGAELGLSMPQARTLLVLRRSAPRSMGDLAASLPIDPSSMTGLIDRLESSGLVERVPVPEDRRIRGVILTQSGARVRRRLIHAVMQPPACLKEIGRGHQLALTAALEAMARADVHGDLLGADLWTAR